MCDCDVCKWLLEVTKQSDIAAAQGQVQQALNVLAIQPQIGVAAILVGPGGALNLATTTNLSAGVEGMENFELALMDVQREVMTARRRAKDAQSKPAAAPAQPQVMGDDPTQPLVTDDAVPTYSKRRRKSKIPAAQQPPAVE